MSDNPTEKEPQPPYPEQTQEPVGSEAEMDPPPDYGVDSYKGTGRLQGKVALITGGDSGIGRAIALAYAREGADVLISYLDEHEDANETVRVVEESGQRAIAVPGDIGNYDHCEQLVQRTVDELGGIDILVNNAAYQQSHDAITEIPMEEVEYVFRTNILAMFALCKAAVPHMQPGSSIINTTSIQATSPSPQLLHYAATKGAITNFTHALAKELGAKGIRVNGVAPGPVWTPLIPMSMPAEVVAEFGKDTPMGRAAQPIEVATAYVFLASEDARFVAGAIIHVTGGES